ncbi:hypothetical protein [Allocoleopsis sp.]|uniref:hypothetical protein n=1 Tax=Allocoleopsis sp. TaxID=3088169 RepID=UPI002FD4A91A
MESKFWSRMFLAAAVFNFLMGGPIMLAPKGSYALAYIPLLTGDDAIALKFWADFGFSVLLIGVGYYLVSRDVTKNHSIVWLGVFAKLFDVIVLSYRFAIGVAKALVIFPAVIDGVFVLLFVLFLYKTHQQPLQLPREKLSCESTLKA